MLQACRPGGAVGDPQGSMTPSMGSLLLERQQPPGSAVC